jgi:uncharacterized membrane protein YoaK (UPF0700 family)
VLTAFSAGLVDVLSFAKLGGVFTSAMTGNLALLGFYAATGAVHSAIKSLSALALFMVGCATGILQSRHKPDPAAVRHILGLEIVVLSVCAIGSLPSEAKILLLAFAMGLQSIVGARLKQTNVVFTTTLIKIVSAAIGARREEGGAGERNRATAVVVAYLLGASAAGATIAARFAAALLIPVAAIGAAFVCARGIRQVEA